MMQVSLLVAEVATRQVHSTLRYTDLNMHVPVALVPVNMQVSSLVADVAAKQAQLQAQSTAHHVTSTTKCAHLLPSVAGVFAMQVSSLVAEVAAKQAQLQALEVEREALTAKARALDQLVASAGE